MERRDGDGDCAHRLRRVVPQDAVAIVNGATAVMRAAERHLHLFVCRACRCCEEVQTTSHHWATGALFLSARREKQLFLQAMCCSASMLPTGHHAAVSLQCHSHCGFIFTNWLFVQCNACFPHCTSGPPSFVFFAGPLPAAPNWEAARFLNTLHLFMLLGVLGSNGCGDVDFVVCFEWWRCVPLLLSFCRRCLLQFLDRHARKANKQAPTTTVKFEGSERTNSTHTAHTHTYLYALTCCFGEGTPHTQPSRRDRIQRKEEGRTRE
ncbi:hypothetical protein TCDM_13205 [Trypanosoma cruzi Dm28c]|uniref:Uncharacterized protein n=1 Tax=Trypanosoma cruzi Dm28c TaxID=1416333 RepID=V5CIY1_TRYCR|nr:hypothetical protein TCDM_13205 [Trypanosoma cruzi Dm28c]